MFEISPEKSYKNICEAENDLLTTLYCKIYYELDWSFYFEATFRCEELIYDSEFDPCFAAQACYCHSDYFIVSDSMPDEYPEYLASFRIAVQNEKGAIVVSDDSSDVNTGMIVFIVIGSFFVVLAILYITSVILKRKRNKKSVQVANES